MLQLTEKVEQNAFGPSFVNKLSDHVIDVRR